MRCRAIVLHLLLLLVPGTLAAPYLQAGYDAARTGASPGAGPETDDVAWRVSVPGSRGGLSLGLLFNPAPPLIIGRHAYVLTSDQGVEGLTANAVFRIGLDDAQIEEFLRFDTPPLTFSSDGTLLFVGGSEGLDAFSLADGTRVWSWEYPILTPTHAAWICTEQAVTAATVYVVCTDAGLPATDPLVPSCTGVPLFAAVDTATGTPRWTWNGWSPLQKLPTAPPLPVPAPYPPQVATNRTFAGGISILGPYVLATTWEFIGDPCPFIASGTHPTELYGRFVVSALDDADGTFLWHLASQQREETSFTLAPQIASSMATGDERQAFFKMDSDVIALTPARGVELWREPVGTLDAVPLDAGASFALTETALFAASAQTVYRFPVEGGEPDWSYTLAPTSDEFWGTSGFLVADGALYARAARGTIAGGVVANSIYAFDVASPTVLWHRELPLEHEAPAGTRFFEFALGAGVLVAAGVDGSVWAVGATAASPVARATISSGYPPVGQNVTVDASSSGPGVMGPPTAFRADWGDGVVTDWQPSALLQHSYEGAGPKTARVQVRNDANQTASTFVTFDVGGAPPARPTFLSRLFERDNQDLTFGILGIALAAGGGLFAVARTRARRHRVQRELDVIERAYAQTHERPPVCEAALAERRAHVQGLGLDGKLEQAEVLLIERRIDEISQRLRVDSIEEQFPFLPLGMARTLRDMLADGRIVGWERTHFLDVLERDVHLSEAQKVAVREQVEAWFARDAGGRA